MTLSPLLKKLKPDSLIIRLTGWYALSVFLLVLLVALSLYGSLIKILTKEDGAILMDRLEAIRTIIKESDDPMDAIRKRVEFDWASRHAEQIYVQIEDKGGRILIQSPNLPLSIDNVFKQEELNDILSRPYASLESTISSKDPKLDGATARVALNLSKEQKILEYFKTSTVTILVLVMFLCALLGIRMAKAFFAPIQNIIDKTRHIRATNLHERIEDQDLPEELASLATTVNEMLDRLEDSFSRLSRFSADLAHELRTPINNILGEAEVALTQVRSESEYKEILSSVMEETGRLSKIIDSLLFLAKAENPQLQLQKESINLSKEVANIIDFFGAWASEENVDFKVAIPSDLEILADRTLLQRVLTNVISNAVKFTPRGGKVTVSGAKEKDQVVVTVADTGTGIAENDIPHVFERFYRGDPSRTSARKAGFPPGTGLGLTIVKSVMGLHHGYVHLESELGRGTKVILQFPGSIEL